MENKQSKFTLPSLDQVEQARKPKKPTLFFTPRPHNDSTNPVESSTPAPATTREAAQAPPLAPSVSPQPNPTTNREVSTLPSSQKRAQHTPSIQAPPKRTVGGAVLVNPNQQKNPILRHIHNVPWETDASIRTDYVVGGTTGVLYLSLRYHRLYPSYIYDRMQKLTHMYVLKVLLVMVDIDNYHDALRELNRTAILNGYTLILAWSNEEAGRYLETYKAFENKSSDMIRERVIEDYYAKMTDSLTHAKSVNKTDVLTLLSNFGSFSGIAKASKEQLTMCPGFGEQKVRRLQQAFSQPFVVKDR